MYIISSTLIPAPFQHKSATETDLRREFESYGTIERVRIVRDKKGRGRGYAFIVYERERDMKGLLFPRNVRASSQLWIAAYKESDGLQIMGKRILVDVERGRTVRGWKPRRLGGGLGGRPKKVEPAPAGPPPTRGGFRGGGFGGKPFGDRGGGFRGRGFGGNRGGFGDRGGGGFRGGFGGGDGGFRGGFRDGRDDHSGGFRLGNNFNYLFSCTDFDHRGRGGGIGFHQGGGFSDQQHNGFGHPPGPGGFGGPPGGHGGFGGGFRGDLKREGPGGYDDRDAKRPRY